MAKDIRSIILGWLLVLTFTSGVSDASVVNVDATVNGDVVLGFPAVTLSLTEGVYESTLITPSIDPLATFIAWNPWSGSVAAWRTKYVINPLIDQAVLGGQNNDTATAQEAFDLTDTKTIQFTLYSTQDVQFYLQDNVLGDNQGGISLQVVRVGSSASVPIPAAMWLFGSALAGLGLTGRYCNSKKTV